MLNIHGKNIYLIGMMGCGKSTIAPLLASRLGYRFIDTDKKIEESHALSISKIFETMGEPKFREFETEALKKVAADTQQIVATGGGIAIEPKNWSYLREGLTIWLDPSVDLLVERLNHDTNRPILANCRDLRANLTQILADRRHSYALAKIHIPITQNLAPEEIVDRILKKLSTITWDDNSERNITK